MRGWGRASDEVIDGPPGTGKTFLQHYLIRETLNRGGRVLYLLLTAQLASRMREKFGKTIDVDTFHAVLGDGSDGVVNPAALFPYSLVLIDECYHMNGRLFAHFNRAWKACDRVPAAVLAGDRQQLGAPGGTPAYLTPVWKKSTFSTMLKVNKDFKQRCQDPVHANILRVLRMHMPSPRGGRGLTVPQIVHGRKAWNGPEPTVADIRKLFREHPETTILTVSRVGASRIDDLCMQAKYPRREPLVILPGDMESNPANYYSEGPRKGKLKPCKDLKARQVPIHVGMPIYMTRNVIKRVDFVNGMMARVEAYDPKSGGLRVLTNTGHRLTVFRWTDKELGNRTYYPIRPGFASTILKFQGAELRHVTIYLDVPGIPGAAYTAISRVATARQWLIGGRVGPKHFTPRVYAFMRSFTNRQIVD